MAESPLEIVSLSPRDVIVLWVEDLGSGERVNAGARVKRSLRERGHDNLVIALHDGSHLAAIDPEMMARHGWVRKEASHA